MYDDGVGFVVKVSVGGDEASIDTEQRAADVQVVGFSKRPKPDQDGGLVLITSAGKEAFDSGCGCFRLDGA